MREIWSLLGATVSDWYQDRAQRLGAALAYYMIFALAPGLIIVIAVAGLLLGRDAEVHIVGQIRGLIGEQGAIAIEATIRQRPNRDPRGDGDGARPDPSGVRLVGRLRGALRMDSIRSGGWRHDPDAG